MPVRVYFELKNAAAFATGVETIQLLNGKLVAVPREGDEMFDVFQDDGNGEPVGDCLVQMGSDNLRTFLAQQ